MEGEARGGARGIEKTKLGIAKNMLQKGYEIQSIQEITGLSQETIEQLKKEL